MSVVQAAAMEEPASEQQGCAGDSGKTGRTPDRPGDVAHGFVADLGDVLHRSARGGLR